MIKSWYVLNINVNNAIRQDYAFDDLIKTSDRVKTVGGDMWMINFAKLPELFNTEWLDYMKSIEVEVDHVLLFYRNPWFQHPEAHIDLPYNRGSLMSSTLNWVIGEDTSEMVWFKTPDGINLDDIKITQSDNPYLSFPMESLEKIDSHRIGNKLTLVRVDIPHNIVMGPTPRWAVSLRTKHKTKPGEWNQVVEFFERHFE